MTRSTALSATRPLRSPPPAGPKNPDFDESQVHNVGRNQEEFIRAYGERVIPKLRWPAE